MYQSVLAFAPLPNGKLYVELDNNECGIFDMNPYMKSDFFSAMKNESYFNRAYIEYGVITWPNGQDISPATIRLEMVKQPCPAGIKLRVAELREYA
jgi:hypothetical protein